MFTFTFRHLDSSVALQEYVQEHFQPILKHFEGQDVLIRVDFERDNQGNRKGEVFRCAVKVTGNQGEFFAEDSGEDMYHVVIAVKNALKNQLHS